MTSPDKGYFKERKGAVKDTDYRFDYRGYSFLVRYEYICSFIEESGKLLREPMETHELRIGWKAKSAPKRLFSKYHESVSEAAESYIPYRCYLTSSSYLGEPFKVDFEIVNGSKESLTTIQHKVYPEDFKHLAEYLYRNPDLVYSGVSGNSSYFQSIIKGLVIRFLVDRFDYEYDSVRSD